MTKIEAIIPPWSLEKAQQLLTHPWIAGMTVSEVKGARRERGPLAILRGAVLAADFLPELKLELVVPDPLVPRIVHELTSLLRSARNPGGKLFVTPVSEAVRIRNGERGEDAL